MGHDAMFDKLRMINGQWPRPGPWYAPNVGMAPTQLNHHEPCKKEGKKIYENHLKLFHINNSNLFKMSVSCKLKQNQQNS